MPEPCFALECLNPQLPHADRLAARRNLGKIGASSRRAKYVVAQLVGAFPPVHKNGVERSRLVDHHETNAVTHRCGRRPRKPYGGDLPGAIDEQRRDFGTKTSDRVELDCPTVNREWSQWPDRSHAVRKRPSRMGVQVRWVRHVNHVPRARRLAYPRLPASATCDFTVHPFRVAVPICTCNRLIGTCPRRRALRGAHLFQPRHAQSRLLAAGCGPSMRQASREVAATSADQKLPDNIQARCSSNPDQPRIAAQSRTVSRSG